MQLTATHINYLNVCDRKLWLHSYGVRMEHNSDLVLEGKLTGEQTYLDRSEKYRELILPGGKIDYYDAENAVVHEIKHSKKVEHAHINQVKYYLYLLINYGVKNPSGILEYPLLRQRKRIEWTKGDKENIESQIETITNILSLSKPPERLNSKICRSCSYHDFCYSE